MTETTWAGRQAGQADTHTRQPSSEEAHSKALRAIKLLPPKYATPQGAHWLRADMS
jgi:hypothetical protein